MNPDATTIRMLARFGGPKTSHAMDGRLEAGRSLAGDVLFDPVENVSTARSAALTPLHRSDEENPRISRECRYNPLQNKCHAPCAMEAPKHQRGYLPHFDAPGVTQFVTFQLEDSFPVTRRAEWETILREPEDSAKRKRLEAWLDRGHGECWLRRHDVAELVEKILLEADGRDYRMQAWVVMPNHVHLLV